MKRRLLVFGLGAAGLLAAAAALVAAAAWRARHVPWRVPAAWAPPAVRETGGVRLRHLGTAGWAFDDGRTVVLVDPFVSRRTVSGLLAPLRPDPALQESWCPKADFILLSHAHFDHAADAPGIALRTGAVIVGTPSALNLARSRGVPEERLQPAIPGKMLALGTFKIEVATAAHSPLAGRDDLLTGPISPDAGALWFWDYRQDGNLAFRLESRGASAWVRPAVYAPGEHGGRRAGTLIWGAAGAVWTPEGASALLHEVRPARVLPSHHDNFLQPLAKGPALLPGLDLEPLRRVVEAAAPGAAWIVMTAGDELLLPSDAR